VTLSGEEWKKLQGLVPEPQSRIGVLFYLVRGVDLQSAMGDELKLSLRGYLWTEDSAPRPLTADETAVVMRLAVAGEPSKRNLAAIGGRLLEWDGAIVERLRTEGQEQTGMRPAVFPLAAIALVRSS
jgi:hypothetical protein